MDYPPPHLPKKNFLQKYVISTFWGDFHQIFKYSGGGKGNFGLPTPYQPKFFFSLKVHIFNFLRVFSANFQIFRWGRVNFWLPTPAHRPKKNQPNCNRSCIITCFPSISLETMDQFSWFMNLFFIDILGTNGPIFIIFGYVFLQYLRNQWAKFHYFWICFSSISPEPMDQFSWFLNMFFIDIFGTNGPFFVIFVYVFLQYLRNKWTNFLDFWICFSSISQKVENMYFWRKFFLVDWGMGSPKLPLPPPKYLKIWWK